MQALPLVMLAGTGLQVGSSLMKARGQADAYKFQEAQAQRKAYAARTAADQTDAQLRDELDVTLGNIFAIRAASNASIDSPTSQALIDKNVERSDRQRMIKVGNLLNQANADDSAARYYSSAADQAMTTGWLNAGSSLIKGLGGLFGSS